MKEYKPESNEESYILSYKPQYIVMLIPQYLKIDRDKHIQHYQNINEKYSTKETGLIFNVSEPLLEENTNNIYHIKKDLILEENEKYFVKDIYTNNNIDFIVKKVDIEKFNDLSVNYKMLGYKDNYSLKQSLRTISIEKNYKEFDEELEDDFVCLVEIEWN